MTPRQTPRSGMAALVGSGRSPRQAAQHYTPRNVVDEEEEVYVPKVQNDSLQQVTEIPEPHPKLVGCSSISNVVASQLS